MAVKPRAPRKLKPQEPINTTEEPVDETLPDEAPVEPNQDNTEMYNNIVNKAAEVYKFNPILTGMIILLILIIGALGFYMMRNDDRMYAYLSYKEKQQADLYDRVISMAKECKDKSLDRQNFPVLEFPRTITKGQATPNKGDGMQ